jgi:hypothetical protein
MARSINAAAAFAWIGRQAASLAGAGPETWRAFAIAVLAVQGALCIAAAFTHVMLHGDGAYFVFAIGAGDAWELKWADISVRAMVYLFTVAPSEWLTHALNLSPMQTAAVNGFIFYAAPLLQFAIACAMAWRAHPAALMFPVANYVFASLLGYGFPSEILLAPGFLWIALFSLLGTKRFPLGYFIGVVALAFTHELAFPAVLIAAFAGYAHFKRIGAPGSAKLALACAAALLIALLYVRGGGGGVGSDSNAIYVFDPRRVLTNPTLWLALIAAIGGFLAAQRVRGGLILALVSAAAAAFILAIHALTPSVDFEDGRYDSTRTLIGGAMAVLALVFTAWRGQDAPAPAPARWTAPARAALAAFFAAGAASAFVFLLDWNTALGAQARLAAPSAAAPVLTSRAEAGALITPAEAASIERMGYFWTLPYRAMVLANGANPGRMLFEAPGHPYYCARAAFASPGVFPAEAMATLERHACAPQAPPGDTLLNRLRRTILRWLGQDAPDPPADNQDRPASNRTRTGIPDPGASEARGRLA